MMATRQQIEKILSGDVLVTSCLIQQLEDQDPAAKSVLKGLSPNTGQTHVIGITGSPGVGKSPITDTLIAIFRDLGRSVGPLIF